MTETTPPTPAQMREMAYQLGQCSDLLRSRAAAMLHFAASALDAKGETPDDVAPAAERASRYHSELLRRDIECSECRARAKGETTGEKWQGRVEYTPIPVEREPREPHAALVKEIDEVIAEDGFSGGPDKRKSTGKLEAWCPECSSYREEGHDEDCRWLRDHRLLIACRALITKGDQT